MHVGKKVVNESDVSGETVDSLSRERICAGSEFQVNGAGTDNAREEKLILILVDRMSGQKICVGRT